MSSDALIESVAFQMMDGSSRMPRPAQPQYMPDPRMPGGMSQGLVPGMMSPENPDQEGLDDLSTFRSNRLCNENFYIISFDVSLKMVVCAGGF